jgi:hypothetical protein
MARSTAKKTPVKRTPRAKAPPAAEPAAAAAPPGGDAPVPGAAEAFAELLPEAQAIPAREVRPLRGDPALALHNVDVGLAAVAPHEGALAALPAPFEVGAMRSLRRAALAVIYAAAQVDRASPGKTRKLLQRAAELRDLLLSAAAALMKSAVLPAPKVKKILAGRGTRDLVQDCVDLAQLFRDHAAAVRGKTAITKAEIDEAAEVGNQLLSMLKPARAKSRASAAVQGAVDARDRLWTLLSRRHRDQLRRAGMWLWLDEVDDHVPPLLSGVSRRAKKPGAGGDGAAAGGG